MALQFDSSPVATYLTVYIEIYLLLVAGPCIRSRVQQLQPTMLVFSIAKHFVCQERSLVQWSDDP